MLSTADSFLRVLSQDGVISASLRDRALALEVQPLKGGVTITRDGPGNRKAADVVRNRLVEHLGLADLYELDRLDLTVDTTLDRVAQDRLAEGTIQIYKVITSQHGSHLEDGLDQEIESFRNWSGPKKMPD